jgi:hypothetical protein
MHRTAWTAPYKRPHANSGSDRIDRCAETGRDDSRLSDPATIE